METAEGDRSDIMRHAHYPDGTVKMGNASVAANVRRRRTQLGLTVRELSAKLAHHGHRMLPSAITKLENGERRADVDDLLMLAWVLDTTPNWLLMPETEGRGFIALHDDGAVRTLSEKRSWADGVKVQGDGMTYWSAEPIWEWLTGQRPLNSDRMGVPFNTPPEERAQAEARANAAWEDFQRASVPSWAWVVESTPAVRAARGLLHDLVMFLSHRRQNRRLPKRLWDFHLQRLDTEVRALIEGETEESGDDR